MHKEVRLRSASVVTATLGQQSTKCGNDGPVRLSLSGKLVECSQRFWELDYTLFWMVTPHWRWNRSTQKACARRAVRSSSSGEPDQRFPDKVAANHVVEEAMEEAFGLKIMKNETTEASTGRSTRGARGRGYSPRAATWTRNPPGRMVVESLERPQFLVKIPTKCVVKSRE